jgi:hypothetical protein
VEPSQPPVIVCHRSDFGGFVPFVPLAEISDYLIHAIMRIPEFFVSWNRINRSPHIFLIRHFIPLPSL